MKLFLVGDFPKDDKTYTGVEGVLVNLANELIERTDVQLVLISLSPDCDLKRFENRCKTYKLKFRTSFFSARTKFNEIVHIEKPDIIHLQDIVPGVLLYKKKYKHIFVVTQHAVLSEERLWQVSLKRKILFKVKELIEMYYFRKIRNIIFISEYNKNVYFVKAPSKRLLNFQRIPNPVNEVFFQVPAPPISVNGNELYFVGEIKKRKGLHVLIRALHVLKQDHINCKLHVIGGFKESHYKNEVIHLVESLDLTENVLFSGWKNQTEIIEYSKKISVFVLPSFQETLPLSIAEAMCQGKIVVATNICGIPEMVEDGVSGYLFQPGDFIGLAGVLKKIFENMEQQKDVRNNAILVGKKFKPKTIVDKTIDFYKTLL